MQLDRRELLMGLAAVGASQILDFPLARAGNTPFPELEAAGSPGAMGLAHGRAFRAAIGRNLAFYLGWLGKRTRRDGPALLRQAARFGPVLREHQPALLEEMQGIARGAGRRLEEILAINARTDLAVVGQRKNKRAAAQPGCTALALTGKGRKGRALLALGQNWDWRKDLARGTVVLRLRPKDGPRLVTFTEAGMVGKIGFNEHRLGVCLNFLAHKSDDPEAAPGVPVHVLLRAVMGCGSLEQAYKMVAWSPRCASANFLMAQHARGKAPTAVDLELTPHAVGHIGLQGRHLVHTNHFKNPTLAPGCASGHGRSTMNRNRVAEALARLTRKLPDPAMHMQRILADRQGAPYSVSKSAAPDSSSETLAGIVMDLSRNRLHLCAGPPHKGRFITRPGV